MKLLLDMNLSPSWVEVLDQGGFQAVHWLNVGRPDAPDSEIMNWARENRHVVFTHDLDFGAILAATQVSRPSVVQFRDQDISPHAAGQKVVSLLTTYQTYLEEGALLIVDSSRNRIRILPLNS
jgi:predicted nuclease of predicted toxin-antitoxin system